MKLEFYCWKCPKGTPGRKVATAFNEHGYYSLTCFQGHVHDIVIDKMLFELLAETAIQAMVDGYYRDAIASFAASYERALQFYIDVISLANGVDPAVAQASWRLVSSQSERQIGMFVGLYQLENKSVPTLLPRAQVELRNRVIHQGYLPAEKEAVEFGQAVVDLLQPLLNILMQRYRPHVEMLIARQTSKGTVAAATVQHMHLVFFEYLLHFDIEADDCARPPVDIAVELQTRRARSTEG